MHCKTSLVLGLRKSLKFDNGRGQHHYSCLRIGLKLVIGRGQHHHSCLRKGLKLDKG